jgi:lipopolysaccharide export LptBFGC system permease protein LptF
MLMGFLVYFTYGNLSSVTQRWVIKGSIPYWPGVFWVILLMTLIGMALLADWYGFQWLRKTLKEKFAK